MKFLITLIVIITVVIKCAFFLIDNVSNTITDHHNKIESAMNVDTQE